MKVLWLEPREYVLRFVESEVTKLGWDLRTDTAGFAGGTGVFADGSFEPDVLVANWEEKLPELIAVVRFVAPSLRVFIWSGSVDVPDQLEGVDGIFYKTDGLAPLLQAIQESRQ